MRIPPSPVLTTIARFAAPVESRHPWVWAPPSTVHQLSDTLIERVARPFEEIDFDVDGIPAEDDFRRYARATVREGLWATRRNVSIEPVFGCLKSGARGLETRGALPANWQTPGFRRHLVTRAAGVRSERLPTALSLRMKSESNYWHALHDIVGGKLRLAEEGGVSDDVPIIVSQRLASRPFFAGVRSAPALRGRTWVVQDRRDFVSVDRLFFAGTPSRAAKASIDHLRRILGVTPSDRGRRDRLFIVRSAPAVRTIANQAAVTEVCRRLGFRIVDTAGKSLDEQIEMFSNAGFVAGVHGAGLTNIVFRCHAPLSLLEILDPAFIRRFGAPQPTFFLTSRLCGHGYHAILGASSATGTWNSPSLHVDADLLHAKLVSILESA